MENNKKYIIGVIFLILLVAVVGTYAWITYRSNKTAMVLTIGDISSMEVRLSPYQIKGTLSEVTTYTSGILTEVTAANNSTSTGPKSFTLYYKINDIDSSLASSSLKYTITRSTNGGTSYGTLTSGNFVGTGDGTTLTITEDTVPAGLTYYYKVYLWLNSGSSGASGNFDGELRAEISTSSNIIVDLPEGLIPVTISSSGAVTAVSKNSTSWYDYDNKVWANAVLVSSDVRSTYQAIADGNASASTPISDTSKILAYYVYIPRYSYEIWTLGVSNTGGEREIKIKFENNNMSKSTGNAVGQYYTHPAFTFGDRELNGIWVGKFETSAATSSTCYTTAGTANCNSIQSEPRILPNVDSLRYQTIGNQYQTAMVFSGGNMNSSTYITTYNGNNTYGLDSAADSHMMKNSEWGAVAYLSLSKYGINTEIRKNNYRLASSNYYRTYTGCGATEALANSSSTVTTCAHPYGTVSGETFDYPQSTTGNISGIFDMSGGAYDRVMGHYGTSGDSYGFAAGWFTEPQNSKYFDLYDSSIFTGTNSTNVTFCTLATCGGHALNETKSWYSDYAYFVTSSNPWFYRGGYASGSADVGAFYSLDSNGTAYNYVSWRSVLVDSGGNGGYIVYAANLDNYNDYVTIGSSMPNNITQYNSPEAAMAAMKATVYGGIQDDIPFFLKYAVKSSIVTEGYIGFVVTSSMASVNSGMNVGTYYIKGGDGGASFLENARTIYDAFGGVGCSGSNPYNTTPSSPFRCHVSGLDVSVDLNGAINSNNINGVGCNINSNKTIACSFDT